MRNRSLIGQIILAVLALMATTWIAGNLLNLGREETTPITERMVGIQSAYGTGGQNPTPTPCPYGCSACCNPNHCTPALNDNNQSFIYVTNGNWVVPIGDAGSWNHCYNWQDWDFKGIHFQLIEDATHYVFKKASDYDRYCDQGGESHGEAEEVEDVNAREVGAHGFSGVIASCTTGSCTCDGTPVSELYQPTASGKVYYCFNEITVKKNGNKDYEIHWNVEPKMSSADAQELCAAPVWGQDARVHVIGSKITGGANGTMDFTGMQAGWTGCIPWDGSFDGGGQWDETYLHVDVSQNYITDIITDYDSCYQASPPSDLGGDLLIPACSGGSGCSLGSRGGGPQGEGFSMCSPPFQTPSKHPPAKPGALFCEPLKAAMWGR